MRQDERRPRRAPHHLTDVRRERARIVDPVRYRPGRVTTRYGTRDHEFGPVQRVRQRGESSLGGHQQPRGARAQVSRIAGQGHGVRGAGGGVRGHRGVVPQAQRRLRRRTVAVVEAAPQRLTHGFGRGEPYPHASPRGPHHVPAADVHLLVVVHVALDGATEEQAPRPASGFRRAGIRGRRARATGVVVVVVVVVEVPVEGDVQLGEVAGCADRGGPAEEQTPGGIRRVHLRGEVPRGARPRGPAARAVTRQI